MRPESRAPKIIELHRCGYTPSQIARQLSCSTVNVWKTLKRHGRWVGVLAPLQDEHIEWINREAKRSNLTAAELARAILVDAICEAQEKEGQQ